MKPTAALAYIRQLCCLGHGGEAIMPVLLGTLHDLVPSSFNIFFWLDDKLNISNAYDENLAANAQYADLYFREFHNTRELEAWPGTPAVVRQTLRDAGPAVVNMERYMRTREWQNSDYHNLLAKPMGVGQWLVGIIHELGRPLGLLCLYRGERDPAFTTKHENLLDSINRYVAHGLHSRSAAPECFVETGETGLLIFDRQGRLRHLCPKGRELLFLAAHSRVEPGTCRTKVPPVLPRLCQELTRIFEGRPGVPPVLYHCNHWGKFVFRAHWLEPTETGPGALIGVTVQRHEPLSVHLMRKMRTLPLSAKQQEACLLLAQGKSQRDIAAVLQISHHTAAEYIHEIYNKLGVSSRDQFMAKLTGGPADMAAGEIKGANRPMGTIEKIH